MDQLNQKTKELEDLALHLTDFPKDYPLLLEQLEKIRLLQKQTQVRIDFTASPILADQYRRWQIEKETYLQWLNIVCLKIKEQLNQNQSFLSLEKKNLENLIQFITKYNTIYPKITNKDTSSKIQRQINDLYQNIFQTAEELIGPKKQRKEKPSLPLEKKAEPKKNTPLKPVIEEKPEELAALSKKGEVPKKPDENNLPKKEIKLDTVTPFFNENEPLNAANLKKKLRQYAEITNQSYESLQKEFFPRKEKKPENLPILYHIQDSFKIPLNAKLFSDETVNKDLRTSTSCYTPEVKRKIHAIGVKKDNEIIKSTNQAEIEKLIKEGASIISVESLCKNKVEGWFQIKDIEIV